MDPYCPKPQGPWGARVDTILVIGMSQALFTSQAQVIKQALFTSQAQVIKLAWAMLQS